jgi:hypothetical protein
VRWRIAHVLLLVLALALLLLLLLLLRLLLCLAACISSCRSVSPCANASRTCMSCAHLLLTLVPLLQQLPLMYRDSCSAKRWLMPVALCCVVLCCAVLCCAVLL